MRFFDFFLIFLPIFFETSAVPIETPDTDERNDFVVRCPAGWGYRTFKGNNGLIGVFWPKRTSFNLTDTAIFVFLQDYDKPLPKKADNIHLFREKCTKANFKFSTERSDRNPTKSLGEKYFRGRCGRTMVIMEEVVGPYRVVLLIASAKMYITKKQLLDFKEIARAYRSEAQEYFDRLQSGENIFDDEEEEEESADSDEEGEEEEATAAAGRKNESRKGTTNNRGLGNRRGKASRR